MRKREREWKCENKTLWELESTRRERVKRVVERDKESESNKIRLVRERLRERVGVRLVRKRRVRVRVVGEV